MGEDSGVVTFLITDQVGSTRTLAKLGEDAADALRQAYFTLLRTAAEGGGGHEVKNLGDGLMYAFASPAAAVGVAVRMQEAVAAHNVDGELLDVRIGLYVGEPVREDGDYFGTPVVVASRLCAAAKAGQILAGDLVAALVGTRGGFAFSSVGPLELKGLTQPVSAVEVLWNSPAGVPVERPAARRRRRSGPRGPALVGRTDEIGLLEDAYARARDGEFGVVLLAGEPGIGKTRLAAELLGRAAENAITLSARAHTMASTDAFGLWVEALDPYLQELGDDQVADLCGGFLDDLAGLFHRVAAVRGARSSADAPRPRLLAGLTRLIGGLAAREPLVVLLDDAHWADASSWEVLRHLARQLDDSALLILLTARRLELAEHEIASQVLFELDQDGLLTRLELGTLSALGLRALAAEIAGREPPAALVEWLAVRSGGNALYAIGLLRALLEEGADLAAPALKRLPEGLAERISARMRGIEPAQVAVLEMVAVAGRPVAIGDLTALTALSMEELGPILADLVARRGVVESERGRTLTYEMSHPLVRDLVYDGIGAARRRAVHRRLGQVLRAGGHVAEAARHYARAAEPGDVEAVEALLEAMREAETREAAHEALGLLAELVELLPPGDRRWVDVLDAMNWRAEWVSDHRVETHTQVAITALRAIDGMLTDADDPARAAVVKFRLAHFLGWNLGEAAEAERLCGQARDLFAAAGDDDQRRRAERELAWTRGLAGDLPGMAVQAQAVAEAAEAAGDRFNAMQSWAAVAYAVGYGGRFAESETATDRVLQIARRDEKSYRLLASINMQAVMAAFRGNAEDGRALLDQAKLDHPGYRETVLLEAYAGVAWIAGDYQATIEAMRESMRYNPIARRRVPGRIWGALAAVELGDLAQAEALVGQTVEILGGRDFQVYLPMARHVEAICAWARGNGTAAVGAMRAATDRLLAMGCDSWVRYPLFDLADLGADLGDVPAAAGAAEDLAALAARTTGQSSHGLAMAAAAWAAMASGEPKGAVDRAAEAVELLGATDWRGVRARVHHLRGTALHAVGDRTAAAAEYEQAARLFAVCGACDGSGRWRRCAGSAAPVARRWLRRWDQPRSPPANATSPAWPRRAAAPARSPRPCSSANARSKPTWATSTPSSASSPSSTWCAAPPNLGWTEPPWPQSSRSANCRGVSITMAPKRSRTSKSRSPVTIASACPAIAVPSTASSSASREVRGTSAGSHRSAAASSSVRVRRAVARSKPNRATSRSSHSSRSAGEVTRSTSPRSARSSSRRGRPPNSTADTRTLVS